MVADFNAEISVSHGFDNEVDNLEEFIVGNGLTGYVDDYEASLKQAQGFLWHC